MTRQKLYIWCTIMWWSSFSHNARTGFGLFFCLTSRSTIFQSFLTANTFLGIYQYFGTLKVSCSRTPYGDRGVRTLDLWLWCPKLYHWATAAQWQDFGSDSTSPLSLLVFYFYLKSWDKKINKTLHTVSDFCLACFGIIITHYKIYSNIIYINKQLLNN